MASRWFGCCVQQVLVVSWVGVGTLITFYGLGVAF